jgi:hypothetical protein
MLQPSLSGNACIGVICPINPEINAIAESTIAIRQEDQKRSGWFLVVFLFILVENLFTQFLFCSYMRKRKKLSIHML